MQVDAIIAPTAAENLPTGHMQGEQAVAPDAVAYVPAAHNVHPVLLAEEYMPGGHSLTLVAPPVAATAPATAPLEVQVAPESPDWKMEPNILVLAANLLKSGDAKTPIQF